MGSQGERRGRGAVSGDDARFDWHDAHVIRKGAPCAPRSGRGRAARSSMCTRSAPRARAAASNDRQWHCPRCAQPKSFGENGHDGLSGASLVQDTVAGQERKPVLLHCLCRQRVEEWNGEPMVCCDGCKEWFHTDCIGMRSDVYNGAPCISSCCLLFCPLTRHLPSSQSYLSQVTTSGSATIALLMVKTVVM